MKHRHTPRDPAAEEFADDMADLLHHRATVPATIWSVLVLAACMAAWLDEEPAPQAQQQLDGRAECPEAAQQRLCWSDGARSNDGLDRPPT